MMIFDDFLLFIIIKYIFLLLLIIINIIIFTKKKCLPLVQVFKRIKNITQEVIQRDIYLSGFFLPTLPLAINFVIHEEQQKQRK